MRNTSLIRILESLPEEQIRRILADAHPEVTDWPIAKSDLLAWLQAHGSAERVLHVIPVESLRSALASAKQDGADAAADDALAQEASVAARPEYPESFLERLRNDLERTPDVLRRRARDYIDSIEGIRWNPRREQCSASVTGTVPYELRLDSDGRDLCTCPYGEEHGNCKHLAAFRMRLLRDSGALAAAPAFRDAAPPVASLAAASPLSVPRTSREILRLRQVADLLRGPSTERENPRMRIVYVLVPVRRGAGRRNFSVRIEPRAETFLRDGTSRIDPADLCAALARRTEPPKYASPADLELVRDCGRIRADDWRHGYGTEEVRHGNWQDLLARVARTGRLVDESCHPLAHGEELWRLVPSLSVADGIGRFSFRLEPLHPGPASVPLRGDWFAFGRERDQLVLQDGVMYALDPRTRQALIALAEAELAVRESELRLAAADLQALASAGAEIPADFLPAVLRESPLPRVAVAVTGEDAVLSVAPFYPSTGPISGQAGTRVAFTLPDGNLAELERDLDAEDDLVQRLGSDLDVLGIPRSQVERGHLVAGAEALRRLALVGLPGLEARGWTLSEAAGLSGWRVRRGKARLRGKSSGLDWFDLTGVVDFDGFEIPLSTLVATAAVRSGGRLGEGGASGTEIDLPDGSRGQVSQALLRRLQWIASLGTATADGVRLASWHSALADDLVESGAAEAEDPLEWRARLAQAQAVDRVETTQPESLQATLRHYQIEGLSWLADLRGRGVGGILADDMGLGKTVQVIAHLCRIFEEPAPPALVIAPASVAGNWVAEIARFAPHIAVRLLHGPGREELRDAPVDGPTVFVTTYGILPREEEWLEQVEFSLAVLDESQAIRNPDTVAHRACAGLRTRQRLCLTGTPIENSLADLWAQFAFLNPGLLGPREDFLAQFEPEPGATPDLSRLRRLTAPFWLRRTKDVVAPELPPREDVELRVELDPRQAQLYKRQLQDYQARLLPGVERDGVNESNRFAVLTALLRLRQIACAPELAGHKGPSAKLDLLLDKLSEDLAEGHKALVFSSFTTLLDLVAARLERAGTPYLRIDGSTSAKARTAAIRRFQEGDDAIFLISLKAGGAGINLTGADYVFLLDPWWNPAAEEQAAARSHRIGQTRPVVVYRMVARDTIEERILSLARSKAALARDLFDAGEKGGTALTAELVRELLA